MTRTTGRTIDEATEDAARYRDLALGELDANGVDAAGGAIVYAILALEAQLEVVAWGAAS